MSDDYKRVATRIIALFSGDFEALISSGLAFLTGPKQRSHRCRRMFPFLRVKRNVIEIAYFRSDGFECRQSQNSLQQT